jgi:hypothetical protein
MRQTNRSPGRRRAPPGAFHAGAWHFQYAAARRRAYAGALAAYLLVVLALAVVLFVVL